MAKSVLCKFREIFRRKFPNVDFENLLKMKLLSMPLKEYRVPFSKINGLTLERKSFTARRWYSWLPDACVAFRSATQKEDRGVLSRSPKNEKSNLTATLF